MKTTIKLKDFAKYYPTLEKFRQQLIKELKMILHRTQKKPEIFWMTSKEYKKYIELFLKIAPQSQEIQKQIRQKKRPIWFAGIQVKPIKKDQIF